MTPEGREEHVRAVFDKFVMPVLEAKGNDYSGDSDVNSNFRIVGQRLDLDKYKVWAIYFEKHLMAIETWLRDRQVKSEPIHMRIVDAINYLLILWAMGADDGLIQSPVGSSEVTGTT